MVAPLIPVIIGGQLIRMAAPTAMTLLRSGAARALPRMRDVGSQSAGPNPAGPFYSAGRTNFPPPRFNPLGRGAAGLGAAGMVAAGGPAAPERGAPLPMRETDSTLYGEDTGYRPMPVRERDSSLFGEDAGYRPAPMRISGYDPTLEGRDMPPGPEDAPPPPRRPVGVGAPMSPRRPETGAADSILRRIFSGQDYQSSNALAEGPERGYSAPVVQGRRVNWGDSENAADFFRADRAAREMGTLPPVERASGGQVGQGKAHKDAALVKALEIIERLMSNGR